MLEPFGKQRDIAYVVVAPDNAFVLSQVRFFFRELSRTYELCRFGRHRPLSEKLRDGIMRVGSAAAQKVENEPPEEWFRRIGKDIL